MPLSPKSHRAEAPQEILVVGAAIVRGDRCLAVQRSSQMTTPLKWEFPGGKVEVGESPPEALRREIREELGIDIEVRDFVARGIDQQTKRRILLDVYLASFDGGEIELREHRQLRWCLTEELSKLDWATPDLPAVRKLEVLLSSPS